MINYYNTHVHVISKTVKGQVFFRRLLKRQQSIIKAFGASSYCPRVL